MAMIITIDADFQRNGAEPVFSGTSCCQLADHTVEVTRDHYLSVRSEETRADRNFERDQIRTNPKMLSDFLKIKIAQQIAQQIRII